jgi:hypothetical protein
MATDGGGSCYTIRGISGGRAARYIRVMRVAGVGVWLCAVLLMGLHAWGSVTLRANPKAAAAGKIVVANRTGDARAMRESLRRDVALHPDDFIVFATEAGAKGFFAEHRNEEEIERDRKVRARGVVGYWQGKTIVVLPLPALATQY